MYDLPTSIQGYLSKTDHLNYVENKKEQLKTITGKLFLLALWGT